MAPGKDALRQMKPPLTLFLSPWRGDLKASYPREGISHTQLLKLILATGPGVLAKLDLDVELAAVPV